MKKLALRELLFKLQDGRCFYCDSLLYLLKHKPEFRLGKRLATIDHLVPRAEGGVRHNNSVLACIDCNIIKASRMPSEAEKQRAEKLWIRLRR